MLCVEKHGKMAIETKHGETALERDSCFYS
jgi:hypothetical protein